MSVFVTDTHPLVWFTLEKHSLLSKKALAAFAAAEKGEAFIRIPAVVLWETAILERGGRIVLHGGFSSWSSAILKNPYFDLIPLEPETIALGTGYGFNSDPFDKMIAACATHLDLPLITKDTSIAGAGLVEIYW